MQPLVSILIPAYNAQEWIADTITSALAQTWPKKEVIVVDDGSSDRTLQVARQFASKTVRIVTQANQGASAARNTAFSICQGDYIQWLDADDLLEPDKVEKQVQHIGDCSSRTLLSGPFAIFMYRKHKAHFAPTRLWCDLTPVEWMLRKMGENLYMQTGNWLVSRELSTAVGPWDSRLWKDNDGEYFCRVIRASDGIRFVPNAKSYYRRAGFQSVSYVGRSNKKLESYCLSIQLHVRYLRSIEDTERTRLASIKYIRTKLHVFYPYRLDLVGQLRDLITELGGEFQEPRLSWKYNWILALFGWSLARRAQILMPKLKTTLFLAWDKGMFRRENRTVPSRFWLTEGGACAHTATPDHHNDRASWPDSR